MAGVNREHRITEEESGIRLDRWVKRHYPLVAHGMLEKMLRKGAVRCEGKKAKSSDRLAAGQLVSVPESFAQIAPEARAVRAKTVAHIPPEFIAQLQQAVLYRDARVIVLNKPAGVPVQGGSGQKYSIDAALDHLRFDAKERPRLVHRLDKDTSGVLVLARTVSAASTLAKLFAGKSVEKYYWALAIGLPKLRRGTIDLPLAKQVSGKNSYIAVASDRDDAGDETYEKVEVVEEGGKRAVTHYEVLDHLHKTLSWVEMLPVTGRTHQLRVHMAATGHPLLGDGKYGGSAAFLEGMPLSRKLHLHARRIVITGLPGEPIDVTAPLPPHMQESFTSLGFEAN